MPKININQIDGVVGDLNYTHEQPIASGTWTVIHNLGKFPSVTVIDTGGNVVEGAVNYIDDNTLTIIMNASYAGKAYIN